MTARIDLIRPEPERVDATIQIDDSAGVGLVRITAVPRLTADAPSQEPGVEEDASVFVGVLPVG